MPQRRRETAGDQAGDWVIKWATQATWTWSIIYVVCMYVEYLCTVVFYLSRKCQYFHHCCFFSYGGLFSLEKLYSPSRSFWGIQSYILVLAPRVSGFSPLYFHSTYKQRLKLFVSATVQILYHNRLYSSTFNNNVNPVPTLIVSCSNVLLQPEKCHVIITLKPPY